MKLVLDIENTVHKSVVSGKELVDSSPYNSDNKLVSVGIKIVGDEDSLQYLWFNHKEITDLGISTQCHDTLQEALDNTTVLIGHNLKYDLAWLRECGLVYDGLIWDTMICEYVLSRGIKRPLKLSDCVSRAGIVEGKKDILDNYMSKGISVDEIPLNELEEYGKQDVLITEKLYQYQINKIESLGEKGVHMMKAINLMNDFLIVLTDMERAGVAIDIPLLQELEKEYTTELEVLNRKLNIEVQSLVGSRPINLNSSDDRSELFYSRKVKNKKNWAEVFNIGSEQRGSVKKQKRIKKYSPKAFARHVIEGMETSYKTVATVCKACSGKGTIKQYNKNGELSKRQPTCKICTGTGIDHRLTSDVAGLKLIPRNEFARAAGFATGSDEVEYYLNHHKTPPKAKEVLAMMARHNKLTAWTDTFIAQLLKYNIGGIIHPQFNQCITATGRLSCTRPNLQNQPKRDPEFKIRKVFKSRWEGGGLMDADFGQLEFRIAAYLSGCVKAQEAILNGVDIHSLTRDFYHGKLEIKPSCIQPEMTRQDAKAETFGPLFGKKTDWTAQFYLLFPGIEAWHKRILNEAVTTGELRSPSGRIYAFPSAQCIILQDGTEYVVGHTQIKNYMVQGFATGDIVLLVLLDIYRYLRKHNAKSMLVLQVHDSATTDVYPGEKELVIEAYKHAFSNVYAHAKDRFGIDINVPLNFELSYGPNWLDQETIM